MKPLTIHSVHNDKDRKAFLSLPWKVYQDDPYWVPPIFSERMHFITAHPFLEHADVEFFMAKRGAEVVGTIAAFINHRHNEFHNDNIGFFGFFEVLEDPEAAAAFPRASIRARCGRSRPDAERPPGAPEAPRAGCSEAEPPGRTAPPARGRRWRGCWRRAAAASRYPG